MNDHARGIDGQPITPVGTEGLARGVRSHEPRDSSSRARHEFAGDFDGLLRAHRAQVARWAARLGGRQLDVGDVTQEVFLAAYKGWPGFRGDALPTTWL